MVNRAVTNLEYDKYTDGKVSCLVTYSPSWSWSLSPRAHMQSLFRLATTKVTVIWVKLSFAIPSSNWPIVGYPFYSARAIHHACVDATMCGFPGMNSRLSITGPLFQQLALSPSHPIASLVVFHDLCGRSRLKINSRKLVRHLGIPGNRQLAHNDEHDNLNNDPVCPASRSPIDHHFHGAFLPESASRIEMLCSRSHPPAVAWTSYQIETQLLKRTMNSHLSGAYTAFRTTCGKPLSSRASKLLEVNSQTTPIRHSTLTPSTMSPMPLTDHLTTREQNEVYFTNRCAALIQTLRDFWPRQMAEHQRVDSLSSFFSSLDFPSDPLCSHSSPSSSFSGSSPFDPLDSLSPAEYEVYSTLPIPVRKYISASTKVEARVRSACLEFNRRVDARYILSDAENNWMRRMSAAQRYELWKDLEGKAGMGKEGKVEERIRDGLAAWNCDRVLGWRYDFEEVCKILEELKALAILYTQPGFSHETYTLSSAGTYTEVNLRTRWDMLRVLKLAFLTFCEMEAVHGRPGVYSYRGRVGPLRYRIDEDVDRFPRNILNMVFFAPNFGARQVTYEDLERELEDMKSQLPADVIASEEMVEPFGEHAWTQGDEGGFEDNWV
ncbi:hypothetical protein NMY22_g4708 [Coprinellus aureogranulatus]|nr:hypothetical protein NMY22_g4708 [Coprinellus aureogranulatus]